MGLVEVMVRRVEALGERVEAIFWGKTLGEQPEQAKTASREPIRSREQITSTNQ
jgi:hypothetical protein